jgi:hypothetical protein
MLGAVPKSQQNNTRPANASIREMTNKNDVRPWPRLSHLPTCGHSCVLIRSLGCLIVMDGMSVDVIQWDESNTIMREGDRVVARESQEAWLWFDAPSGDIRKNRHG